MSVWDGLGEEIPPVHFIMNISQDNITSTTSTSFTYSLDRDGKVWYNEDLSEIDIENLTVNHQLDIAKKVAIEDREALSKLAKGAE